VTKSARLADADECAENRDHDYCQDMVYDDGGGGGNEDDPFNDTFFISDTPMDDIDSAIQPRGNYKLLDIDQSSSMPSPARPDFVLVEAPDQATVEAALQRKYAARHLAFVMCVDLNMIVTAHHLTLQLPDQLPDTLAGAEFRSFRLRECLPSLSQQSAMSQTRDRIDTASSLSGIIARNRSDAAADRIRLYQCRDKGYLADNTSGCILEVDPVTFLARLVRPTDGPRDTRHPPTAPIMTIASSAAYSGINVLYRYIPERNAVEVFNISNSDR
jgi:hypothetical protein